MPFSFSLRPMAAVFRGSALRVLTLRLKHAYRRSQCYANAEPCAHLVRRRTHSGADSGARRDPNPKLLSHHQSPCAPALFVFFCSDFCSDDGEESIGPGGSGGALSPICRTFPSSSDIFMPLNASNSAGTCAAIFAMSPVILLMPAESPLPVDTMVILSTCESGALIARTISGSPVMSLSTTAAWLYSW